MLVPPTHDDVAPGLLLSQKTTAGNAPPYGQQGGTRLRLFVSLVKPSNAHVGAFEVPSSTVVRTAIVAPALKVASDAPPSPKMPNSASFHPCARVSSSS